MKVYLDLILVIGVYSTLAITGLLGNLWVLTTVSSQLLGCTTARGRPYKAVVQTSAYIYLLVLSIVDLVTLISVPIIVVDIYKNHFPLGLAFCKLLFICEGLNKTLSPLVLTALSLDRYIAVCHPTLHWMRQTMFSSMVILGCCLFSLVFLVPIITNSSLRKMQLGDDEVDKCTLDDTYWFDLTHSIMCYLVPLTVICAVYMAILTRLFIHTRFSAVGHKTSISLSRVVKCSVMVVAFYFICWTPYWTIRMHALLDRNGTAGSEKEETEEMPLELENDDPLPVVIANFVTDDSNIVFKFDKIFVTMYMVHALPYAQSAFNWLFYAFLNHNLRNSTLRCANGTRSAGTSTVLDNGGGATVSTGFTPIWRNIQQMGTQIKTAGIDTGNALLKMSPFRGRSRIQSRSSACLECSADQLALPSQPTLSASLLDIPRRPSLAPRQEPSLVGKALSYTNLPQYHIIDQKEESSHGAISESSSVEWL